MSTDDALVNFRDDAEVQEAVKQKCKELGMSRTELFRQTSRRFLGEDGLDSPESMLARADELDAEADEDDAEADELETRAELKRNEAERKRRRAEELRENAEDTDTYEEDIADLATFLLETDRHLFAEHKRVTTVANDHGVSPLQVLDDVQEETGLPTERFEQAGRKEA